MFSLKCLQQSIQSSGLPRLSFFLTIATFCAIGNVAVVWGQWRDDFEAGPPRWLLWRDDASARVLQSQRITLLPHSGLASELVEFRTGFQGTYVHLVYPLRERLAVIDELRCSLWLRAAASGMRVALRVVFPRTAHPATQSPLTTLLMGTASLGGGQWSMVEVRNPVALLEAQRRVLRAQYGPATDLREAYVDAIVLDVYNGPGDTKLQIDDLAIDGMIDVTLSVNEEATERQRATSVERSEEEVALEIAERARDLRASVPRWLQYRGESLDWLATLGFNGIVVDDSPTRELLDEAQRLQLAVIAPPPSILPPMEDWESWQTVQGWSLGWALDHTHLVEARDTTIRLNRLPATLRRPTLAEAMESHGPFARLVDLLAIPLPLPTTIRNHDQAEQMLRSQISISQGRSLPLTSITIEQLEQWHRQREQLAREIGSNALILDGYDLGQARLQLLRGVGHGARGWYFRSLSPLDGTERVQLLRADSLKALNAELQLIAPWIQGGEPATRIAVDPTTGYLAYHIPMPRSQLILLMAHGEADAQVVPSTNLPLLPLNLPRSQQTTQAYRISRGTLESLPMQPSTEGWSLSIPNPSTVELVVVTEDPRAIAYLQTRLAELAPTVAESRLAIAEQSLQLAQMTMVAEQIPERDPVWEEVNLARSSLRGAQQFLGRGDLLRCLANADAATAAADRLTLLSWERARTQFPSINSSPWLASRLSLPLHWELDRLLRERTWEPLALPQGDLSDMQTMIAAGWTFDRRLEDRVESQAQLISRSGPEGSSALQLSATTKDRSLLPGGYAGASLRIGSPILPVPLGAMIHIQGLVRVLQDGQQPQSGLLVYDDFGGPALGQLIDASGGDPNTWQRIDLYRLATQADGDRLYLELRGQVQVMVAELTAEFLMPSPSSSYPTRSLSEFER
jgi:hypothetical protein